MNEKQLSELIKILTPMNFQERLNWINQNYPNQAKFSSSLGLEDQIISDYIFENKLSINVFTLDTGRLFEETLELLDKTRRHYQVSIDVYTPYTNDLEKLISNDGAFSFYESIEKRKKCCYVRKVIPLQRALKDAKCWITGIRAEQSNNRKNQPVVEWDDNLKILKIHPLLEWSWEDSQDFVKEKNIPINSLHQKSYPSIGCAPCTKAVKAGDNYRSGRWWWEQGIKECGLHVQK